MSLRRGVNKKNVIMLKFAKPVQDFLVVAYFVVCECVDISICIIELCGFGVCVCFFIWSLHCKRYFFFITSMNV
jgi:hypothetical protein